jgi:chemotaxis-related protein WspB
MAIDARSIVEVLPPVSCLPALGAPGWVRGLFCYRGALTPLVDAATLLGAAREPDRMSNRILVIRGGAEGSLVGLWVESVLEIDSIDFEAADGHPGFATPTGRFLGSVVQTRWGQVQQIKPQEMFTAEQAIVLQERNIEVAR